MAKIYVIGDKETGVLLVMISPLRAAVIPRSAILAYAAKSGKTFEVVFGEVAAAAQKLIVHSDQPTIPADVPEVSEAIGAFVERGSTVTDAEFCFIADVDESDWGTFRGNCIPIEPAINILGGLVSGTEGKATEVPLKGIQPEE